MSNILVTGALGFIGSHMIKHLAKNKSNHIYGLQRTFKHESTYEILKKFNITLIVGDINNKILIEEILNQYNIDKIYHFAAKAIVQDSVKSPLSTSNTNILGTLNLLESIRSMKIFNDKDIPTFIMSTDKSYGISENLPYKEDYPLNGLDIYSASKACVDILARSYAYNYNLPIVVARPSNTYGFDFNWSRIIPSLAKSCLSKNEKDKPLILNEGSYKHLREYNYVDDVILAIELLLDNINKTKGESYNIGCGYMHTTEEIVEIFLKMTNNKNKKIEFRKKQNIFKEIPEQYLDVSKLISVIKWKPKYKLYDGLEKTINEYKEWFDKNE